MISEIVKQQCQIYCKYYKFFMENDEVVLSNLSE